MEYRYIITSAIAFLALQIFLFSFTKTISWLFSLKRTPKFLLGALFYVSANALIILHLTRTLHAFRAVALMLALLLFAFFISILTACLYKLGQHIMDKNKLNTGLKVFYPLAFCGLVGLSIYNAYTPTVVRYSVTLDKPLAQPLRIGMASDLHLGKYFGAKQLDKLADIMNQEKVDLILMPGDIMDDNVEAYVAENMQPHLAKLRAPLGVYATLGNHDFFGAEHSIYEELTKAGIKVLWDEAETINNQFVIVGRNDDLHKARPSAQQILSKVDTQLPIFLMDHRPTEIEQHAQLPIDIQVSGHAHKGQIFPASIITKLMYRLDYGYEEINKTHFFVTSGYGFWGIPMRLGSQSEVMIIDVKGK
ncbi:metallophosphoesterase [Pasteurellaceae bacterium RH1A]|nr:metallophosphoesterase [Pasteurellaceae bacterium RH1A]